MYSLCLYLLLCFLPFFVLGKHNTHTASFLFNNSKCFLSNKISIFPRFPILVFISCNLTFGFTKLPILKKLYLLFLKEHIFINFFCQFAKVCRGFEEKNSLYHYFLQLYFYAMVIIFSKKPISPTIRFKNSTFSNFLQQLRK